MIQTTTFITHYRIPYPLKHTREGSEFKRPVADLEHKYTALKIPWLIASVPCFYSRSQSSR